MSENKTHIDIGVDTYQDELDLHVKHLESELEDIGGKATSIPPFGIIFPLQSVL
jgi:hypothetical protein